MYERMSRVNAGSKWGKKFKIKTASNEKANELAIIGADIETARRGEWSAGER